MVSLAFSVALTPGYTGQVSQPAASPCRRAPHSLGPDVPRRPVTTCRRLHFLTLQRAQKRAHGRSERGPPNRAPSLFLKPSPGRVSPPRSVRSALSACRLSRDSPSPSTADAGLGVELRRPALCPPPCPVTQTPWLCPGSCDIHGVCRMILLATSPIDLAFYVILPEINRIVSDMLYFCQYLHNTGL